MDYVALGRSGLMVSRYVLGTLTFAGTDGFERTGNVNVTGAKRMIDLALEAGVNAIDTANLYSKGGSEEVIGRAIEGRRDDGLHRAGHEARSVSSCTAITAVAGSTP